MPQLSPALGVLIFLGVLSLFLLLIVSLKQSSKPVVAHSPTGKKSSKSVLFF